MSDEIDHIQSRSSSNHYKSLIVNVPDGRRFKLTDIQAEATVEEIARAILDYAYPTPEGFGPRPVVVDLILGDGRGKRIASSETLRDAGVSDGDHLAISTEATAGGGSVWVEVAAFLAAAVASGVAGNAAYDMLKSTVRSIAARWRKRRTDSNASTLRETEAISIAHACACLHLHIADPQQLNAVSARHNLSTSDNCDEWVITFRSSIFKLVRDVSVLVRSSQPEPEGIEVIVTTDFRLGFPLDLPYLR